MVWQGFDIDVFIIKKLVWQNYDNIKSRRLWYERPTNALHVDISLYPPPPPPPPIDIL